MQHSDNQPLTSSTLPQNIPILYLWFGKSVPEDYLISLSELDYPYIFLKNPEIKRQFKRELLDIEKSDYYRLQHLYEYGGIYSDFDNVINYKCLMKFIEPYRTQGKLVFMTATEPLREKSQQMNNNMIFAPYPKMPILKRMLEQVDETQSKIWQFAGMKFVAQFPEIIELSFVECFKHTGDWSWFAASNEVLGNKLPPMVHYTEKLKKKSDFIRQNIRLSQDIDGLLNENSKLHFQLISSGVILLVLVLILAFFCRKRKVLFFKNQATNEGQKQGRDHEQTSINGQNFELIKSSGFQCTEQY